MMPTFSSQTQESTCQVHILDTACLVHHHIYSMKPCSISNTSVMSWPLLPDVTCQLQSVNTFTYAEPSTKTWVCDRSHADCQSLGDRLPSSLHLWPLMTFVFRDDGYICSSLLSYYITGISITAKNKCYFTGELFNNLSTESPHSVQLYI